MGKAEARYREKSKERGNVGFSLETYESRCRCKGWMTKSHEKDASEWWFSKWGVRAL